MSKQVRKTHKVFGSAGVVSAPDEFYQFGSLVAGSPLPTTDIATIQAQPAWVDGLQDEIYPGNKASPYEELNALFYEHSYQVGQIFQDGIAEYDAGTTYYIGSVAQDAFGRGQIFQSLINNNVGNAPPNGASDGNWRWLNPPSAVLAGTLAANRIPKVGGDSSTGPAGSKTLTDSLLSDDGTYVIMDAAASGLKFPDGSIQAKAATSVVTNQNVVTGSRALNTTFQNTGSKPMFVSVSVGAVGLGGQQIGYTATAQTDSSNPPTTGVGTVYFNGNSAYSAAGTGNLFFIVLPGNYYRISSNGSLVSWTEWS